MQSRWLEKTVKRACTWTSWPPSSSPVCQLDHPSTSGQPAKESAHLMPKRLRSRSARPDSESPTPDSQMIWAIVQPAGWPYSSWHSRAVTTISLVT